VPAVTKLRPLVLALGLVTLLLAGASLQHVHVSSGSALWNEEHDLGLMAALSSAASLPDAAPLLVPLLAVVLTLAASADRPASAPLRHFASRAPPAR
jgi:hypothetical protein